ncbi:hypothetical protein BASA81_000413 [Batrachochytrium salamandrivorans]|nr:hypothetical protein BASA81_000413 [Batrachochytrium salamandrivorans]
MACSPLMMDIGDFERDIVLLERTNAELKEMIENGDIASGLDDIRFVIVENEFAIDTKLRLRKETRELIPELAKVEDVFHLDRIQSAAEHLTSQLPSTAAAAAPRAKQPIVVGVEDGSEEHGLYL